MSDKLDRGAAADELPESRTALHNAREHARELRATLREFQSRETQRVEDELQRARDQLVHQASLAAIGQLAASIAHDLRNPLGVIRNAAYLLRKRLEKLGSPTDLTTMIDEEVQSAAAIITNLVEMTRDQPPRCSAVDLHALVDEVIRKAVADDPVQWRTEITIADGTLWCDPAQFRHVLHKLLSNAVEALKGAGEIVVAARTAGDHDLLEVRDTGPGIAPDLRAALFAPLAAHKKKGAGLGLLICRQIVERHGGAIAALDRAGPGAVIQIKLPRRPGADTADSTRA